MFRKIIIFISIYLLFILAFTNAYNYEPNASIDAYLKDVTQKFIKISSYLDVGDDDQIPPELFTALARDFQVLKYKLPQDNPRYKIVYEKCELTSRNLAAEITRSKLDAFTSQCFSAWKQISSVIFSKYAVKARISANPQS